MISQETKNYREYLKVCKQRDMLLASAKECYNATQTLNCIPGWTDRLKAAILNAEAK